MHQHMGDMGPQELAQLWWSLGRLQVRPSLGLQEELWEVLAVQREVLAPQEVAMVLYGHARWVGGRIGGRAVAGAPQGRLQEQHEASSNTSLNQRWTALYTMRLLGGLRCGPARWDLCCLVHLCTTGWDCGWRKGCLTV